MKRKDILIEVQKIAHKLNKAGHTPLKIIITDDNGNITVSSTTAAKLQYLDNVESDIKTSIDEKLKKDGYIPNKILVVDDSGSIMLSDVGRDKLVYLTNVNKDIQEQIEDIKKSLALTDSEVDSITRTITQITQNITSLTNIVSEITTQVNNNGQAITEIQSNVSKATMDIEAINTSLGQEKNKLISLTETVTGHTEKIEKNATDIATNKNDIELLKTLVGAGGEENSSSSGVIDLLKPFVYIVDNTKENAYSDIVIQQAIDKAKLNGGGIVFIPFGEYLLQNELLIYSNIKILGVKGTVLKRRNSLMKVFMRAGLEETSAGYTGIINFEVDSITFDGESKTETTGMLCLGHGDNLRVVNCHFKNLLNSWHMIEINGCRNVTVVNNIFENYNGTEAIQIDFMLNDEVYPFPCLKDDTVCDNIVIKQNIFKKIVGTCIGNHSFKVDVMPKNITVEENYFDDISEYCVHISDVEKLTVRDNTVINAQYGVSVDVFYTLSKEIRILDNYMDLQNRSDSTGLQGRGIVIAPSGKAGVMDVIIRNNMVKNANRYGIALTASNVIVDGNTVTGTGLTGIWFYGGEYVTVVNNYAKGNNIKKDPIHYDLAIGGNPSVQQRYTNLTNNNVWTFGIKTNSFPLTIIQNNFMTVPVVDSGIITPNAFNNYLEGSFRATGLVK